MGMVALFGFGSSKLKKLESIERKLLILVEKKEKKLQMIDDHGRDLVMALQEYLFDKNSGVSPRRLLKESSRYLRENQHYF